jgi:hypothetical protein
VLRRYVVDREDARERLQSIDFDCSLVEVMSMVRAEGRRRLCLLTAAECLTITIPSDVEGLIPLSARTHCLNSHPFLNVIAEIKWRYAWWNWKVVGMER